MFQMPATVLGMIGSAVMVASFSTAETGAVSHSGAQALEGQVVVSSGKTNRLPGAIAGDARHQVSVVELVGVSRVKVILRDESGRILFQSDPQTNTTLFSRNTDLPVLTLKEENASAVTRKPVSRRSGDETLSPKRGPRPAGCVGSVSPLAQGGRDAMPSLCVTKHEIGSTDRA